MLEHHWEVEKERIVERSYTGCIYRCRLARLFEGKESAEDKVMGDYTRRRSKTADMQAAVRKEGWNEKLMHMVQYQLVDKIYCWSWCKYASFGMVFVWVVI